MVFDVTDQVSFDQVSGWMDCIQDGTAAGIPLILVGNKVDLEDQRVVSSDSGQALANKFTNGFYFETSALTGQSIQAAFEFIAHKSFDYLEREQIQFIRIEEVSSSDNSKLHDSFKVVFVKCNSDNDANNSSRNQSYISSQYADSQ